MTSEYELFALHYATREARRHEHFIGGDPHDGPMPMDYFVWVAKNADRAVVIDIGFTAESGGKRGRKLERCPIDSLSLLGVDPAKVEDVILTHMHYDHVGNFHKFPKARFHLQEPEIHYAVGRHMRHKQLARSFEPDDVCGIVRLNFDGRVTY
jgi:glyoxylase-like metal-dependent hydrolase (beta-lactamase superfamily II)